MATLTVFTKPMGLETLSLDEDTSIVLPKFDTSNFDNNNLSQITLSLFVLDSTASPQDKIHVTVNPFDPITKEIDNGLSLSFKPIKGEYVDMQLPIELFKKIVNTPKNLLLRLVTKNVRVLFSGIESTTNDPRLVITSSSMERTQVVGNIYNITVDNNKGNIIVGGKHNSINNVGNKSWQENIPLYIIIGVVIVLLGSLFTPVMGWALAFIVKNNTL